MENVATSGAAPLKVLMQAVIAAVIEAQRALDARAAQLASATEHAAAGQNNAAPRPSPGTEDGAWFELLSNPCALVARHRYRIAELCLEFEVANAEGESGEIAAQTRLIVGEPPPNTTSETSMPARVTVNPSGPVLATFSVGGSIRAMMTTPDA